MTAIVLVGIGGLFFVLFRHSLGELMNRYMRWYYGPTWSPSVDWGSVYLVVGLIAVLTVAVYLVIDVRAR